MASALEMFENLSKSFDAVIDMVEAITYVSGIVMVFRGIGMLKVFGQHITQMSSRGEVAGPLVYIIVGAILIYLPTTLDTSLGTLFGTDSLATSSSLLAYVPTDSDEKWRQVINVLVKYMQLVGFIAFVRGWFILARMGNPGVQPGSMGKGITHLVGGLFAMNIIQTMEILANTLGWSA